MRPINKLIDTINIERAETYLILYKAFVIALIIILIVYFKK